MGLSQALSAALSGVTATQQALSVISGNVANANTNTYTVTNAQTTSQGNYAVVVSNYLGSVTSINAGLTFHEPILHRDADTFGIGMGWAKVSQSAAMLDRDTGFYTGSFYPVRTSETYLEMTYQYQLTPAVQIQPDIQYVFNPGGGILNPNVPGATIKNELVFGLRTNLLF